MLPPARLPACSLSVRLQVRDSAGNLNGAHPSSHGDHSLHAWVSATSRQRLDRAVGLLLEVMQPTNTTLHPIAVAPGRSVVLAPVVPRWAGGSTGAWVGAWVGGWVQEGKGAAACGCCWGSRWGFPVTGPLLGELVACRDSAASVAMHPYQRPAAGANCRLVSAPSARSLLQRLA